jgi:phosphatidylserine/phosphatidylglycerophosphate/cardiolipin synthase-like enzyme
MMTVIGLAPPTIFGASPATERRIPAMMQPSVLTPMALVVLIVLMTPALRGAATHATPTTVGFTPGGSCTDAIVEVVGEAKRTLLGQAYSFPSAPIAKALLDAHKRGVQVQVILDKSQRTEKSTFHPI